MFVYGYLIFRFFLSWNVSSALISWISHDGTLARVLDQTRGLLQRKRNEKSTSVWDKMVLVCVANSKSWDICTWVPWTVSEWISEWVTAVGYVLDSTIDTVKKKRGEKKLVKVVSDPGSSDTALRALFTALKRKWRMKWTWWRGKVSRCSTIYL